jgi:bacterioferritin
MAEDDKAKLVAELNRDHETEFQSIVQYTQHVATVTGAEYMNIVDELKVHLGQELTHAEVLAEQVNFLDGVPSTTVPAVPSAEGPREALLADLSLESDQLERYRARVQDATELGLVDVAEALRPLLTQTQEHVRDLQSALGR